MNDPLVFVVAVFGVSVGARLFYCRWEWWLAWFLTVSLVFMLANLIGGREIGEIVGGIGGAALIGFVAPDLWQALRTFLQKPRNAGAFLVVLAALAAYSVGMLETVLSEILGYVVVLGMLILGLRVMFSPFRKGKKK